MRSMTVPILGVKRGENTLENILVYTVKYKIRKNPKQTYKLSCVKGEKIYRKIY